MKNKTCNICKLGIDVDKEYAEFKHYENRDVIKSKAYYHIECFRERILSGLKSKEVENKALQILDQIGSKLAI